MSSERENTDWMRPFNFRDSELFINMAHFLEENLRDNGSIWSDDGYARMVMGLFYYEKGDFVQSAGYLHKALTLDDYLWRPYLALLIRIPTREICASDENPWNISGVFKFPPDLASKFFQLLIHSDNDRVNALINLGIFYRDQAEAVDVDHDGFEKAVQYYNKAGQCFEKVTKLDPSLWQANMMLFMCYTRLGIGNSEIGKDRKRYFFDFAEDYKIFDNDETKKNIRSLTQKLMKHSPGFRKELARIADSPEEPAENIKNISQKQQKNDKEKKEKVQ